MAKSLSQLITEVRYKLSEPSPGIFWSNAELTTYINEAYQKINGLLPYEYNLGNVFTQTYPSFTNGDFLPADYYKVLYVTRDGIKCYKINQYDKDVVTKNVNFSPSSYSPIWYLAGVNYFIVLPINPSYNVEVTYIRRPPALVDDNNVTTFMDVFDEWIVRLATAKALEKSKDYDEAQYQTQSFERDLQLYFGNKGET